MEFYLEQIMLYLKKKKKFCFLKWLFYLFIFNLDWIYSNSLWFNSWSSACEQNEMQEWESSSEQGQFVISFFIFFP